MSPVCCAVEDPRKSNRTVDSGVKSEDAEGRSGEGAKNSGNSKSAAEGSIKYGDGKLTELQIASNIPRCGEKFSATYKANQELSRDLGNQGTYKFTQKSDLELIGTDKKATLTLNSRAENITTTGDIKNQNIIDHINKSNGDWTYEFLDANATKTLKANDETWAKVECSLLPVNKITFPVGSVRHVIELKPALASLITPNAHPDVIRADLKEALEFKSVEATFIGMIDKDGEFVAAKYPTTRVFDFKVELTERKDADDKVELVIKTTATPEPRQNMSTAWLSYNLQRSGVFKSIQLVIDAELRKPKSFTLTYYNKWDGNIWEQPIQFKHHD